MPSSDVLPEDEDKREAVREMFDRIADRYDLLNRILTLGRDQTWRRAALDMSGIEQGSRVADVACGTGDFVAIIEDAGHCAVGIDLSTGMIAAARHRHPGGRFAIGDALDLPFPDSSFDAVTCGFALRNMTSVESFAAEAARILRPGGTLIVVEVSEPGNRLLRRGHEVWFRRVVPRVGGLLSDRQAYSYLPASVVWLPDEDQLRSLLRASGFGDMSHRTFMFGAAQALVARLGDGGTS